MKCLNLHCQCSTINSYHSSNYLCNYLHFFINYTALVQLVTVCSLLIGLSCGGIERHGPYFTREASHRVEFSNSTGAVLHCSANGNPTPVINWQTKDGTPVNEIPGNGLRHVRPDNSLVFPPFRAEDYRQDVHSNIYQCVATNVVGSVKSRDVNLKAVVQQHYTVEVYDEFVIAGNTAVLRCHIPGFIKEYVSVVSWIQDSTSIIQVSDLPGERFSTFSTGELHVRRAQQSDAMKSFRCQVRHKLTGETMLSHTAGRLFVTESYSNLPPRVTDSKPLISVQQGSTAELPCAGQGYPIPTYSWTHNSIPIVVSASNRRYQSDGSLKIRGITLSDAGIYRCFINNSIGSEMIETQLLVIASLIVEIIPRIQTIDVGKSMTFNCSVTGSPIDTIQWIKNGVQLLPNSRIRFPKRDALYITNVVRRDRGMYQCVVTNEWDSVQSSGQLELADDPPIFLQTFADQTLQSGHSLSLKCVSSGNPIPQVTWNVFNSLPVPDNPRYRTGDYVTRDGLLVSYVNISSTMSEDAGIYTCTASNDVSTITHSGHINIYGPPSIRIMPNVTAVAGEVFTITCPVGGYPIDNIFWEKENVRLPYNHRQKVYPNGTLIVTDLERSSDEGMYMCIARQNKDAKTAQRSIYVHVVVRPVIEPFVFPKSLHQSQRYNLQCTVIKGDPPIQIELYKDGNRVTQGSLPKASLVHVTEFSLTLAFQYVQPNHRGNYTCVASNAAGNSSHSDQMTIHVPPRWRIEPIDTSVIKGRTAIIDCNADAYPPPITSWSRAEGLLREPPSEFKAITSSAHLRPYENGSLAIHNAQKSDSGYYMCQASNGIGAGLSKVIKLTVHVAAHFESKFRAETVRKTQETRIKCEAIGDKPITISWLKDKMPFNPRDDVRYELNESILSEGIKSEMIIRNADRRDSALFTCVTSNTFGHDDTNIQLIMQEPPDCPQDVKIVEQDGRSARISWSTPYSGNSPINYYIVQYKLDGDKWSIRSPNVTVSASETTALISGLRPVTQYHVRISAQNGIGKSDPSDVIQLTTIEETPGGPPLHIKAVAISSKTIKVSWKPPRKDLQYGVIRGYYVGYKPEDPIGTTITTSVVLKSPLSPSVSSSSGVAHSDFIYKTLDAKDGSMAEECVLTVLKRATKYEIIVQAYNSKGAGPASELVFAKTLEMDPPSSPQLRVKSSTTNSIQLSWSMNPDDSTPVTGFILYTKRDSGDWEEIRLPGDMKASHNHEWLKCGMRYQYYIVAFNSVGKSEPSAVVSAKTDGASPVAPDKNSLLIVNTSSAVINLDAFHDGGCPITTVEVMYKPQRLRKWISLANYFNTRLEKQIILSELMPSSLYDLKITAFNEAGSTEAQYTFSTSPLALQDDTGLVHLGSKSATSSVPFYADYLVMVPTTISVIVVIILVSLAYVIFSRKPNHGPNNYGNYCANKLQNESHESMSLTEMDSTQMKKLSSDISQHMNLLSGDSANNHVHYPQPYAMTKITEETEQCLMSPSRSSPMKSCNSDHEAIYATVKRTPRPPRSDLHIYQYPNNGQPDSGCETESTMQSGAGPVPGQWRTSFVRFEHEPSSGVKCFSEAPLLYGRNVRRSTHNYQ